MLQYNVLYDIVYIGLTKRNERIASIIFQSE